jgi:hypothetical protein
MVLCLELHFEHIQLAWCTKHMLYVPLFHQLECVVYANDASYCNTQISWFLVLSHSNRPDFNSSLTIELESRRISRRDKRAADIERSQLAKRVRS